MNCVGLLKIVKVEIKIASLKGENFNKTSQELISL